MEPHKSGREEAELLIPEEKPETPLPKQPEPKVVMVEPTLPDPELLYKSVMAWLEGMDECPRVADMKNELGWNPKRANIAINLLEEEGKIKRVPDEKDKRVVRLCLTEK